MDGIYVPIIASICIAVAFIVFSFLNSRNHSEVHKTIRATLENGTQLTPDLVEQLNTYRATGIADLRRGIIITSIGVATFVAGIITDAMREFGTVGVFPLFMGIGFLIVWKLNQNK
ncbi:hypothetical protein KIH87_11860 [Paraneptunicella aestuarii]|uniref:DUF6249 domain-containing protein n=1 Tax=Paraneptunicella aestuarii TaxID=2831148 RepID=UPI001E29318F|nr:DUF6249 domain-containing protein [Paraneptunicella aestuarii]UAA37410.1 hypothetical protein KIH87_11860 [Paraneptunicella aestuarii]